MRMSIPIIQKQIEGINDKKKLVVEKKQLLEGKEEAPKKINHPIKWIPCIFITIQFELSNYIFSIVSTLRGLRFNALRLW